MYSIEVLKERWICLPAIGRPRDGDANGQQASGPSSADHEVIRSSDDVEIGQLEAQQVVYRRYDSKL